MRTMTTINWQLTKLKAANGEVLGTMHDGQRGSWTFRISTPKGRTPRLRATSEDGREVMQEHRSLKAAKNAALALLHPSEAMAWQAASHPIQYRAQWDSRIFVVFETAADTLAFQWRDSEVSYWSEPVAVSGIREGRELAAAVLRDCFPDETSTNAPQAADGPREALEAALEAADISFTPEQLNLAATALVVQRFRP